MLARDDSRMLSKKVPERRDVPRKPGLGIGTLPQLEIEQSESIHRD
jgi:hypothetical protein